MTIIATSHSTTDRAAREESLVSEIRQFWTQFIVAAFSPYRPEQHYMRGPGPAWRAKHAPPES